MPKDKAGKFHLNDQKAKHADKMSEPPPAKPAQHASAPAQPATEGEPHMKVFDHGDGTGHTETDDGGYHDHSDIESTKMKLQQLLAEEAGEGEAPPMPHEQAAPVSHGHMAGL